MSDSIGPVFRTDVSRVAMKNGNNAFTGTNTFDGVSTFTNEMQVQGNAYFTADMETIKDGENNFRVTGATMAGIELGKDGCIYQISSRGNCSLQIYHTADRITWDPAALTILMGNVGIGGDNPLTHLHVWGTGEQILRVESSDNKASMEVGNATDRYQWCKETSNVFHLYHCNAGAWQPPRISVSITGNVGINVAAPLYKLDIGADTIRLQTPRTIPTAGTTGSAGEICWNATHLFVCVATNTWKRAPLATW